MRKLSSIFSAVLCSVFFLSPVFAEKSHTVTVDSCMSQSAAQYFKFRNSYNFTSTQYAIYSQAGNINVDTTLPNLVQFPAGQSAESDVYVNQFTAQSAMLTGATDFVKSQKKIATLCGVTFSCQCTSTICKTEIITSGTWCEILGTGTSVDPYIIVLDKPEAA